MRSLPWCSARGLRPNRPGLPRQHNAILLLAGRLRGWGNTILAARQLIEDQAGERGRLLRLPSTPPSVLRYYTVPRLGLSATPSPPASIASIHAPSSHRGDALVRFCVQWATPPKDRSTDHRSAPYSLGRSRRPDVNPIRVTTSSIRHLQTRDDLAAHPAAARKTLSVKTSNILIWDRKMFKRSAKTVRARGTGWLSWSLTSSWYKI